MDKDIFGEVLSPLTAQETDNIAAIPRRIVLLQPSDCLGPFSLYIETEFCDMQAETCVRVEFDALFFSFCALHSCRAAMGGGMNFAGEPTQVARGDVY